MIFGPEGNNRLPAELLYEEYPYNAWKVPTGNEGEYRYDQAGLRGVCQRALK